MRKIYQIMLMMIFIATLSGCKLGKQYTRPELDLPAMLNDKTDSISLADYNWKELYTDSILQQLISQTLDNNKDMLIAAAKVKELAAMKRISFAQMLPDISGNVYSKQEGLNYGGDAFRHNNESGIKVLANWELDLWGNLRWAKDKSIAEFVGSIENQRAIRMSLIAETARNYFELVALDNELNIVRKTVDARRESLHLARIRYEGGLTSETAFRQAQVELARTATLVPDLEKKVTLKENEIAFLTGKYPHHIKRSGFDEEINFAETLPIGLPSTLLERRPDIRKAEQAMIAANAQVGMAFTDLFPRISLTAGYGVESKELSDLLKSPFQLLSANIIQPIFAMGKKRAMVKAKKAALEQASLTYEKTVLAAFKETYNAITEFNKTKQIYQTRLKLEQASKSSLDLAQLQYINGVIGYIDLLDAQRGYLDAQIGLSNAIRDQHITIVNLYKALGGGW